VKLGKNASYTCAMLSEVYGDVMNEVTVLDLIVPMKMLKKCET